MSESYVELDEDISTVTSRNSTLLPSLRAVGDQLTSNADAAEAAASGLARLAQESSTLTGSSGGARTKQPTGIAAFNRERAQFLRDFIGGGFSNISTNGDSRTGFPGT